MTQPDLSSLALPESPELPAEIEVGLNALRQLNVGNNTIALLRSVIAKHLLTAEEARYLAAVMPHALTNMIADTTALRWKLLSLTGSTGEE